MTAIDRTAYPRPGARLTREELGARYDLTETDLAFVHASARVGTGRLLLAMLLKTRRDLGCFPAPNAVHAGIVAHLAAQLGPWQGFVPGVHTSALEGSGRRFDPRASD